MKLLAEALIVTDAIYDVRESDMFPRTCDKDFIITHYRVVQLKLTVEILYFLLYAV